jgi:hypothetical protein
LLQNDPALVDGVYTIDPDGPGGEAPFEVTCNMTTDGGGWIALGLANSDSLYMAENAASNGFDKCADDSAKHFDWITESAVTPDFSGSSVYDISLDYLNPSDMTAYTGGQMVALRAIIGELSSTTRMVAVVADDDNGDWQTSMTSGHEVYIMGLSMAWTLLSPGESGNCTTTAGNAGYYLWHNTAAASQVTGSTGLTNNDLGGLGIGDLLPLQVRLVVATGGGVAFGFEKEAILVR